MSLIWTWYKLDYTVFLTVGRLTSALWRWQYNLSEALEWNKTLCKDNIYSFNYFLSFINDKTQVSLFKIVENNFIFIWNRNRLASREWSEAKFNTEEIIKTNYMKDHSRMQN